MQFNLVTTGPEQIENKKKGKNFFLGNWCIKLDEKKALSKQSSIYS